MHFDDAHGLGHAMSAFGSAQPDDLIRLHSGRDGFRRQGPGLNQFMVEIFAQARNKRTSEPDDFFQ